MSDEFQAGLVTAVAAVALLALVRPYFRRKPAGDVPCPKCTAATPCDPAPGGTTQPIRLVRPGDGGLPVGHQPRSQHR